ncbi:MAG: hypothetical protein HYY25_16505 [Candidatus Wallbacteria bacterium]|nr:hypothetical protein [Candidatus Wallbacteria bacterium]
MLYQRGMLVFHAAAAATPQGAVLIAGDSACGKSTILAALLAAGRALLADDLDPVRIDDVGEAFSLPTSGEVVLWQRSLDILGAVSPEPWRLRPTWRPNRQVADFRDRLAGTLVPLRAAICLKPRSDGTHKVDVIQGWRRLAWLGGITYNYRVLEALAPPLAYFRCAAALGRAVECKTLHYPLGERGLEMLSAKLIGALTGLDARK